MLTKALNEFGDAWHVFRVTVAETILYWAICLMPEGSERKTLERCLYEYVKWVDEE